MPDYHVAWGEPWRLLSATLLHGDPLHLFFNLYCLWVFGTAVEGALGALATALIYLVFATGSMAAEFALFHGGIGLSGVAYGLFGMLWVLSRRDERLSGVMSPSLAAFFVFFFFLGITLTIANIMPIANVAHGAGAILGYLLGWAMSARTGRLRVLWAVGFTLFLGLCLSAAFVFRHHVNLGKHRGLDFAAAGADALRAQRPDEAIALLRHAVRMNPRQPEWWSALASAYRQAGRPREAQEASHQAQIAAQERSRRR